jgi:hypothetical protein
MIEPHGEILQTGKRFHRSVFRVRMADRADLAAAALGKLLLMAADARSMATFARESDRARIVVSLMAEKARHSRMRRVRVKEPGKITGLRLRNILKRHICIVHAFISGGLADYCVTDECASCDQQHKIDGPLSQYSADTAFRVRVHFILLPPTLSGETRE